jgi:hypothetical protein
MKNVCVLALAFSCLLGIRVSAQTVPIHSQVLSQDTVMDFPTGDCQFDKSAKVVTNGFLLTISCKTISAMQASVVSFEKRATDGSAGANGQGIGGNAGDGNDGTYGRRGSKVKIQTPKFIGQTGSLIIAVNGEDGGNGGNGGVGAAGRNGGPGDGPDVSDCWFGSCRRAGGNGGDGTAGGNGGYGGRAGDGGNGGVIILAVASGGDMISPEFHGGIGGLAGHAGGAGAGGKGGDPGNGDKCCGGGHPGANAAPGRAGGDGRNGRNGYAGDLIVINGNNNVSFVQELKTKAALDKFLK